MIRRYCLVFSSDLTGCVAVCKVHVSAKDLDMLLQLLRELLDLKRISATKSMPDGGPVDRHVVLSWLFHHRLLTPRKLELCIAGARDKCMESGYYPDATALVSAWQVRRREVVVLSSGMGCRLSRCVFIAGDNRKVV